MRLMLLAASNRQPAWVSDGFDSYAKRLRGSLRLDLEEIPLARRPSAAAARRAAESEGKRMLASIPDAAHVVALTEDGTMWNTRELAARLRAWVALGRPVYLLIGGPDGLSESCLARADERWSLSRLTLPHGLARIAVAEALYRARSVLERHPYHRE